MDLNNGLHGLTNETIVRLVRLVLKNQYFVYQNQLFRQTMGGGSGSRVTLPLACIYMGHCLPGLITALSINKHELFARYGAVCVFVSLI